MRGTIACFFVITIPLAAIFANFFFIFLYVFFGLGYLSYLIWIFTCDWRTPERGGRDSQWFRGWFLLKWYHKHYFNGEIIRGDTKGEPRLYIHYPHGVITMSVWANVLSDDTSNDMRVATLNSNFYVPILRELVLCFGFISANRGSIVHCLQKTHKSVMLMAGGAQEAPLVKRGIVLDKRKGFVKIAIETGTPIVPVYTFGERDVYNVYTPPKGSLLKGIQKLFRKVTRGTIPYFWGRLWIFPRRVKMVTVYGDDPIIIEKNHIGNVTQESIDLYHSKFKEKLRELHEKHRETYGEDVLNIVK